MSSQLDSIDAQASQADNSSQFNEKQWNLKGGTTMTIGNYYKKKPDDKFRTLDLVFRFQNDPKPKIVELPYTKESLANALMICNTELETFLFLEDCHRKDQWRKFEDFIHQATEVYKMEIEGQGSDSNSRKKSLQFKKPTIVELEGNIYLIASEIFLLGSPAVMLSQEEVNELPVLVNWSGPDMKFETEEKTFYSLLSDIFCDFNVMQNKKFVSFPIAGFTYHMISQFYPLIIKRHGNCSTQMSISGTSTSTGKSLLQTFCMLMFYGEEQATMASLSEPVTGEMLSEGSIFVKEFCRKKQPAKLNAIDARFLERVTKATWEGSCKRVRGKMSKPVGVVLIDGNIFPSDVSNDIDGPTLDKIGFNYTGPDSLSHPEESELVDNILKKSKEVYKFLPNLLSLGAATVLPKVTTQMAAGSGLGDVLKKRGDLREGQRVYSYDLVYMTLKDTFNRFSLPLPLTFQSAIIDRTSMTYFNTNEEDIAKMEVTVQQLLHETPGNELSIHFEHSRRTVSFNFRKPIMGEMSESLLLKLKDFKTVTRPFKGQRQRVIVFPEAMLTAATVQALHDLFCRYADWLQAAMDECSDQDELYGEGFYKTVERERVFQDNLTERMNTDTAEMGRQLVQDNLCEKRNTDTAEMEMELVQDNQSEKMDTDKSEMERQLEILSPAPNPDYTCLNKFCKDYGKVFKYASQKRNHEKASFHSKDGKNSEKE